MTAISVTEIVKDATSVGLPSATPKQGLRGAFTNIPYIGPVLSVAAIGTQSIVHAVMGDPATSEAGGAEDSTGYREKDGYDPTGATGALAGGTTTSNTRPTGRAAQTGAGVTGGSTQASGTTAAPAGGVFDTTGRAVSTGVDRFGRAKGVANVGAGLGTYDYTNFDGRATLEGDGGRALGGDGRGSMGSDGETATQTVTRAVIGSAADGASGTVNVIAGGSGLIQVDLHADDILAPKAGFQIALFRRDADDTDEDGACIGVYDVDGGTDITTLRAADATVTGTTIAVYARRRYDLAGAEPDLHGAVGYGPLSARATLAVT